MPTFILTRHARPPIQMEGGTTFHFVTGGIHEALDRAREAAYGMDVRIGGGPNPIQQYLRSGLIDELHVAISSLLLGRGERLFQWIDVRAPGYECVQLRRRKRPVLYSGAQGTMTLDDRLQRSALPRGR